MASAPLDAQRGSDSDQGPSDRDLLAAFMAGDQASFAQVVARYGGLVLASCRRQLGHGADADDAAQAVFVILSRKCAEALGSPTLTAWLLTVARFVSNNLRRREARRIRLEQEVAASAPVASADPLHDPVALSHLDEFIATLPEHERQVVVLHFLRGQSHEDVARALGCPEGTIRSRLSRGLQRLRDQFARRGVVMSLATAASLLAGEANAAMPSELASAIAARLATPVQSGSVQRLAELGMRSMRSRISARVATMAVLLCALVGALAMVGIAVRNRGNDPTVVDPAAYMPEQAHAVLRFPDLARSRARFASTPYGAFLDTTTGRWARGKLDAAHPGTPWAEAARAVARIPHLRQAAAGVRLHEDFTARMRSLPDTPARSQRIRDILDAMRFTIGVTADDVDALAPEVARAGRRWTTTLGPAQALRRGHLLMLTNAPLIDGLPASHPPPAPVDPDADLEFSGTGGAIAGDIRPAMRATAILDANGVTNRHLIGYPSDGADAMPWRVKAADVRVLRSLPSDTVLAFVRSFSNDAVALVPDAQDVERLGYAIRTDAAGAPLVTPARRGASDPTEDPLRTATAQALTWMMNSGLPRTVTITGDCLLYVRSGSPLPSVTLVVGCERADATEVIHALAERSHSSVDASGEWRSILSGVVPIHAAYRNRAFIITTHPDGVDAHLLRVPGFLTHADARAALAEIPAGAYAAGVLRGSAVLDMLRPFVPRLASRLAVEDRHALDGLVDDLMRVYEGRHDVLWYTAAPNGRSAYASGPIAGLLGCFVDAGMGALPWAGIWN